MQEKLGHFRHSEIVEGEVETTWDQQSLDKAIDHFKDLVEEVKPLAVYTRVGEDRETEEEDLFGDSLEILNVLHMIIFIEGNSEREKEVSRKFYEKEFEWFKKDGKENQFINSRVYALPLQLQSGRSIQTVEEACGHLHINSETHQRIYPN